MRLKAGLSGRARAAPILLLAAGLGAGFRSLPVNGASGLTLIGYVSPAEEGTPAILELAGAWSPARGWVQAPEEHFPPEWNAARWQLFAAPAAKPGVIRSLSGPHPAEAMQGPYLEVRRPAPGGIAVSGSGRLQVRLPRRQSPDRPELLQSTREILQRHGVRTELRPVIKEAWRVDLNGDGKEEVLWTARSRAGWKSPYRTGPGAARPGDFVLLGLRYLAGSRIQAVPLALETHATQVAWYRVLAPLDVNRDGKLEIYAHARYFEESRLLAFTFDGRRVQGIIGTTLP
jgi:hypothetical protein